MGKEKRNKFDVIYFNLRARMFSFKASDEWGKKAKQISSRASSKWPNRNAKARYFFANSLKASSSTLGQHLM